MKWINQLLFERFLNPLWKFLDGKKTISGVLLTLLQIAMQVVEVSGAGFGTEQLMMFFEVLKTQSGVSAYITGAEALAFIGVLHKVYKGIKK